MDIVIYSVVGSFLFLMALAAFVALFGGAALRRREDAVVKALFEAQDRDEQARILAALERARVETLARIARETKG